MAFDSDVGGNKYIQCQRVSLWDSGASRFLSFLFLDIGRLGKMMNAKAEIEVVAKVVASVKWNRNKCGNKCGS